MGLSFAAPLAGRDDHAVALSEQVVIISIHAPLAGRDRLRSAQVHRVDYFNPRAPCGARRGKESSCFYRNYFNPRAPCGARLRAPLHQALSLGDFNPRAPCGARPKPGQDALPGVGFQSTHPLRGATTAVKQVPKFRIISIHAPLAGCDKDLDEPFVNSVDFNPRTPCGVRRIACARGDAPMANFNPRTPCGVRLGGVLWHHGDGHFNPRTPCGVRRQIHIRPDIDAGFQSTHPLRGATLCRRRGLFLISFQSTHPLRGATCRACWAKYDPESISIHAPLAGCDVPYCL